MVKLLKQKMYIKYSGNTNSQGKEWKKRKSREKENYVIAGNWKWTSTENQKLKLQVEN